MRFGIDGVANMVSQLDASIVRGKFHVTATKANGRYDAVGYFVWSGAPGAIRNRENYMLESAAGKSHEVTVHNVSVKSGPNIVVCTAYFFCTDPVAWFPQEVER